jgi:glucoamylase
MRSSTAAALAAVAAGAVLCAGLGPARSDPGPGLPLFTAGIAGSMEGTRFVQLAVSAHADAAYVQGSSVLLRGDGSMLTAEAPGTPGYRREAAPDVDRLVAASRAWLAAGTVPGRTPAEREVAQRALLDLALLTNTDGASVAALFGAWNRVWPRDASWHAAAFAVTGHPTEAAAILRFLAGAQDDDGTWAARYSPEGVPIADGRARQLDATGWVPWATWLWWRSSPHLDLRELERLWPMVSRAATAAADSLRADGLPRASADYWEQREGRRTLGTAAPLLVGLRAAADLAAALGHDDRAIHWAAAARRLDAAIGSTFGATGYRRYADARSGSDSAVAFLTAPLAPNTSALSAALARSAEDLLTPSGGLRPGDIPRVGGVAWTPSTALFALAAAGGRDEPGFRHWFDWLGAHRTRLGALPEKVRDDGEPASVAPLGWTCAIVLLALATRDGIVPIPPVPGAPAATAAAPATQALRAPGLPSKNER